MSTDPIPSTSEDFFAQHRQIIEIPERGTHVPSWYVPHQNPEETLLKQDGELLLPRKTVAQVAPERRWAVRPDGELMPQNEFERRYIQKIEEWYRAVRKQPISNMNPTREAIPRVERYVCMRVDPLNPSRLVEIDYDPARTAGARPDSLYVSREGESVSGEQRFALLVEEYAKPGHGKLKPYEIAEVEDRRGLRSVQPPAETPVADDKPHGVTARCGKVCKGKTEQSANFGKRAHERRCSKCKALQE